MGQDPLPKTSYDRSLALPPSSRKDQVRKNHYTLSPKAQPLPLQPLPPPVRFPVEDQCKEQVTTVGMPPHLKVFLFCQSDSCKFIVQFPDFKNFNKKINVFSVLKTELNIQAMAQFPLIQQDIEVVIIMHIGFLKL